MAPNLKLATRFLGVVLIVFCSSLSKTLATDETAMPAISSKNENHDLLSADDAHQKSHKFTGHGRLSPAPSHVAAEKLAEQLPEVGADISKRALPSSLRFTGLGKRRAGVGAAMRYAGLGKRFPEMPEDAQYVLSSEVDYSETIPDAVDGLLDRRRRYAPNEFDDVVSIEDVDGSPVLYGIRREIPLAKTTIGEIKYGGTGKRNKPIVKISSRVDPGMRYMGIGKRGYDGY